jgi:hypothetical protein
VEADFAGVADFDIETPLGNESTQGAESARGFE